ncbi:MAG: TonB-dependent receptor domain-containing protein, partial [Candidatus Kapaibacterium sp.]
RWGNQNSGEGPGAVISFLGNPGIQPERIKELEMGFEVEFDNAYGIELTYFMQTATNSIFNVVLPPSVGVPSVRKNVGAISGSGVESNLYARLFRTADYQLDLNFIWNYANNVVDDLGEAPPIISEPNVVFVGQPRAAFYTNPVRGALYDSLGMYLKPDVDTSMRKFFGNPVAPNNGSFTVNFRFLKDFTLNLLTDWTIGGTLFNRSKQFLASFGNSVEYNRLHNALGIPNKPGSFIPVDTSVKRLVPGTAEYKTAADRYAQIDPNQFGAGA